MIENLNFYTPVYELNPNVFEIYNSLVKLNKHVTWHIGLNSRDNARLLDNLTIGFNNISRYHKSSNVEVKMYKSKNSYSEYQAIKDIITRTEVLGYYIYIPITSKLNLNSLDKLTSLNSVNIFSERIEYSNKISHRCLSIKNYLLHKVDVSLGSFIVDISVLKNILLYNELMLKYYDEFYIIFTLLNEVPKPKIISGYIEILDSCKESTPRIMLDELQILQHIPIISPKFKFRKYLLDWFYVEVIKILLINSSFKLDAGELIRQLAIKMNIKIFRKSRLLRKLEHVLMEENNE